jgi:wyosine [tRNA(Phe)-imidazoG37] synthetase (radical SAM superfamily)
LKVCPYDCIYCQLGSTTTLTAERSLFFPVGRVLADVERRLGVWPPPDVITVAGCGEPTLFAGMGELIAGIKSVSEIPVALLTNGALFHRADVRAEAAGADIVLPSLDAGDEETFRLVNRPVEGLTLARVGDGLETFRSEFSGQIWLEVMVLAGITDSTERLAPLARLAARLGPDRIHLNTPVRPTFDERAAPVPEARLAHLCAEFRPVAEVIAERPERHGSAAADVSRADDEMLTLLQRRPCTVDDIVAGLDLHHNAVLKSLAVLEGRGAVHRVVRNGHVFWHAIDLSGTPEGAS